MGESVLRDRGTPFQRCEVSVSFFRRRRALSSVFFHLSSFLRERIFWERPLRLHGRLGFFFKSARVREVLGGEERGSRVCVRGGGDPFFLDLPSSPLSWARQKVQLFGWRFF